MSAEGQLALQGAILGNEYLFLDANTDDEPAKIASSGTSSIAGNIYASQFDDGSKFEISSAAGGLLTLSGTLSAIDDAAGTDRNYVFSGAGNFSVAKITDAAVSGDGAIQGASTGDNVNVVKRGAGTLTLTTATSAANDFWQGSTVIEQGVLRVQSNGSGVGELQSQVVEVQSGGTLDVSDWQNDAGSPAYNLTVGQELRGGGAINAGTGRLGIFGDNIVSPGDDGVGTLNVTGGISIGSATGGAFNFELGNTAAVGGSENDLIAATGGLTVNLPTAGGTALNASFVEHGVAAANSNYSLITYASSAVPSLTGLALNVTDSKGNTITPRAGTAFTLNATSTAVRLQVTGNTIASRTWTGSVNGTWDKGATANWSGGDSRFFDFDNVAFDATGANKNITVAATASPGTVTVNGGSYSFSGADISAGSVSITGASTVASFNNTLGGDVTVSAGATLAGAGTFQDDVSISSGSTLQVGGEGLAGGGSVRVVSWNVDNNGTIGGDGAGSLPPLTAEAGVVLVGGWSNTFPDNPVTNLRDDLGNATSLDIAPFSNGGTFSISGHPGQDTDGSWNKELLTGYLNSGAPNGAGGAGVTLSEIPYGEYDLIIYFNSDNDTRSGTVSDGTTT